MILNKRIFSILVLSGMSVSGLFNSASAAEPDDARQDGNIRLMSFNILRGDLNGPDHLWELRRDACLEMLSVRRPDILGTVECNSVQKGDILKANPRFDVAGISVKGDTTVYPNTSANLIFFDRDKFQLEEWGTIWLSETPDTVSNTFYYKKPRNANWARLKLVGSDVRLVYICVHLQDNSSGRMKPYSENRTYYGPECRKREVAVIMKRLPQINPDNLPMLLGGDLNCKSTAEELYDFYNVFDLVAEISEDADLDNTFNGFKDPDGTSRIDHLFSAKCKHSLFAVDRESYAGVTYISDHFPIYTDFTIE